MLSSRFAIIRSVSVDPWFNLALEEYLFSQVSSGQVIFLLWQNDNTVVIGKHQNPWKECRLPEMERDGCKLARRMSGGGAVFHDLGNLNFSFILDRDLYDLERQLRVVLEAVRAMGIAAEFSGRNDLVAQGRKFSGNAFRLDARAALHHGTLLVRADLEKLSRYLNPPPQKIQSKGVESIRARVTNLGDLESGLTVEAMADGLRTQFRRQYGEAEEFTAGFDLTAPEMLKLYHKNASWEWRYGDTPDFTIIFENSFAWGSMEIQLKLENGYIANAAVYSDAMDIKLVEAIAEKLKTLPYKKSALLAGLSSLDATGVQPANLYDVITWLAAQNIPSG